MNPRAAPGRRPALLLPLAVAAFAGLVAAAPGAALAQSAAMAPLVAQEGSELSVAGQGPWIVEVARQLWRLPVQGGRAEPLTAAGQWARRPSVSPDGTRLAFQLLAGGAFQIATSRIDGTGLRVETSGPWHHLTPAWSPDGRTIAFAANRTGSFQIWTLDPASGALDLVSSGGDQHYDPAWDPATGRLAWVSEAPGRHGLHAAAPNGRARRLLSSDSPLRSPAWRPDGQVIAYTAITPRGPRLQMAILSSPAVVKPLAGSEAAGLSPPVWLDDQRLLYAADGRLRVREIGSPDAEDLPFEAPLDPPLPAPRVPRLALEPAASGAPLLIEAGRVLDAAGNSWLPDHDVLVESGRIRAIGPRGSLAAPADATRLDARTRALVPGLIDLSLQLPAAGGEDLGRNLLGYGVTTVEMRPGFGPAALDLAGRWQRLGGGPRVLASVAWCGGGPPTVAAGILARGSLRACAAASDAATLRAAPFLDERPVWSPVGLAAASGRVHAIEYPGLRLRLPLAEAQAGSPLWFQDLVDQALRAGVTLVSSPESALPAVLELAPDLLASRQVRAGCGDGPCPAATGYELAGPAARAALRDQRRVLGRLAAGSGTFVAVSEAPESPYGLGLHAQLRLLEAAGLERAAVLRAATAAAADLAGLGTELGRIEVGRVADLLVVDGDPLAQLRDLLRIDEVVLDGRPVGLEASSGR